MTEEKHGFIHTLLFNLITKRYTKKKRFKEPKSLKTTISATIIEKQINERWAPKSKYWGILKAIFTIGLVLYVGFTMFGAFSSTLEGGLAQNATSQGEAINSTAEQAVFESTNTLLSVFSIIFSVVALGITISAFNRVGVL